MDYGGQDILRCDLCRTPGPPLYCATCEINLCKVCVGEHHLDESKEHKVIPVKHQWSLIPKCKKHSSEQIVLYCEPCDTPICVKCAHSNEHKKHEFVDIKQKLKSKQENLQKDLQELEKTIFPKYEEAASNIKGQKDVLKKNSKQITKDLNRQREILHKEIDTIIHGLQSKINKIESHERNALDKEELKIRNAMSEISQTISDIRRILNANDICLVSKYKSRNADFRGVVSYLKTSLFFTPGQINREQLEKQIGSLFKPPKPLLEQAVIETSINTNYSQLLNVACVNDEEIWLSGMDNVVKLYNLQGELLKSMKTTTGNIPQDIAVTQKRELIYTDPKDRSINIVKNSQIKLLTRIQGWRPVGVCSTRSDKILAIMVDDDNKQTKVVVFSGSIQLQSIQWNEHGLPLFSSGRYNYIKHLTENINSDICVADYKARAVVVVRPEGNLRFRYTGSSTSSEGSFCPVGIAADSQGHILIADHINNLIHIIDMDGNFLQYIEINVLHRPWGLCVDRRDDLFVAENITRKLKKIQYLK